MNESAIFDDINIEKKELLNYNVTKQTQYLHKNNVN